MPLSVRTIVGTQVNFFISVKYSPIEHIREFLRETYRGKDKGLLSSFTQLEQVFILLIYFQWKQFMADFPLQGEYMLKKVSAGWDFLLPLLVHCAVHSVLTGIVVLIFFPHVWWLIIVDFVIHFIMDRIKSGPKYLGRFNDKERASYWTCFGFDQMVHHLTHFYLVWVMVTS